MQEGTGEVFNVFYVCGSVKEVWSMSRAPQEGEEIMKVYCHELCTECIHGFPYEVDYLGVVECKGGTGSVFIGEVGGGRVWEQGRGSHGAHSGYRGGGAVVYGSWGT